MSIIKESKAIRQTVLQVAQLMLTAARTAPKGKGRNTLEMCIVDGDDISKFVDIMHKIGDEFSVDFFHRDAENLKFASAIVIIGTKIKTLGLEELCQLCGFKNCDEKEKYPNTPCVFNTSDLNIAIGSAVAVASANNVDNRIMFSVGKAALRLNLFESDVKIAFGIPLSVTSKNPFFDRK